MSCNAAAFSKAFMKQAKGATLTRARAATTWKSLEAFAKARRMIIDPANMTTKQLLRYVEYRQEQGISARSIQNEVSHIRRALRGAGRNLGDLKDKANNWSSHRLRVPEGSRIGGKPPADQTALDRVERPDLKAVFTLQVSLGLRVREAVQSGPSLRQWAVELRQCIERGSGAFLPIREGTKGGRPRSVWVPPERLEEVQQAVELASRQVGADGNLVQAASLMAAVRACERASQAAGFETHGLRRGWAVTQYHHYVAHGNDEKAALRLLSGDLGHGDGRGRWCFNNYLRGAL